MLLLIHQILRLSLDNIYDVLTRRISLITKQQSLKKQSENDERAKETYDRFLECNSFKYTFAEKAIL